jgi:hypothetical protein
MKIKNTIRFIVQILARRIPFVARRRTGSQPPPEQLSLNLDHITDSGLPLREAIPVRSAEYWLRLGEPGLALKELKTLPEPALRHAWPQRVYSEATHSTPNTLAA